MDTNLGVEVDTKLTVEERRIRTNQEIGYKCPLCDSWNVQSVTALTGRVDAGTMGIILRCNECGELGEERHFVCNEPFKEDYERVKSTS